MKLGEVLDTLYKEGFNDIQIINFILPVLAEESKFSEVIHNGTYYIFYHNNLGYFVAYQHGYIPSELWNMCAVSAN